MQVFNNGEKKNPGEVNSRIECRNKAPLVKAWLSRSLIFLRWREDMMLLSPLITPTNHVYYQDNDICLLILLTIGTQEIQNP